MAVGDVYQIIDNQVLQGQVCQNVYFYRVAEVGAPSDAAADVLVAFQEDVFPLILAVQPTDVEHTSIRVVNLFNPSDAIEELVDDTGTLGVGDVHATFAAYGIRLVGDNAAVRSGSKRIAGALENASTDGVLDDATIIAALDDLAAQLAVGLLFGSLDGGDLVPVVVGRILEGLTYRLPENSGEAVLSDIVDALVNPLITSQVSRKVGVGE